MIYILSFLLSLPVHAAINLEQAMESTIQKNESVGQNRATLLRARENLKQYRGAILPNVTLNGSYLIQPELDDPTARAFFPDKQTTADVKLTQPLFRGLREFAAVRREKAAVAAQEQVYLANMSSLYLRMAEAYMNVLSLEQDKRNVEAQQRIYQGRVKDLQARTRRGESSSTEVLTAQSTSAALEAEFQILNSQVRKAREEFALVTGLPANSELQDTDVDNSTASLKPLNDYLAKIEERNDVKYSKEAYEMSDEDVSIAKGAHWPTADVTGKYYLIRPDGLTKDLKWDITFNVTLPLFEGGITQSRVRQAASQRGTSELALAQARRNAETEIRTLHDSLRMRNEQLKFLKQASDLSEKNYQVLLRDSRRGLIRSIDVQLGLTEYRVAKRTYDQARYQARMERIRLELAANNLPAVLTKDMP